MSANCHMAKPQSQSEKALKLAGRPGGVSARELANHGIHLQTLTRLVRAGALERMARGVYRLPSGQAPGEHHGLALAAAAAPSGIICLLSALQFHGIGTQQPFEVWIALDRRTRKPASSYPPLRIVRFGGDALKAGVERHVIEEQPVRIYSVAKTVADCFKYRNKIGLDVALEALREARRSRKASMDELWRYARVDRVANVMRPYLAAIACLSNV